MDRIRYLWTHNRLALLAFVATLVLVSVFAIRTISATIYWMDPAHQDQALAGWMTPRYVAKSYQLPPEVLDPALFLDANRPRKRQSLDAIAAENGMTLADLQTRIDVAAAEWRTQLETGQDTKPGN